MAEHAASPVKIAGKRGHALSGGQGNGPSRRFTAPLLAARRNLENGIWLEREGKSLAFD